MRSNEQRTKQSLYKEANPLTINPRILYALCGEIFLNAIMPMASPRIEKNSQEAPWLHRLPRFEQR
jgi:hypothetical protein